MQPVVRRADELLAEGGQRPLPVGVTPHGLRHTYASILAALNLPMPYVMQQLGHADPAFTLRVYAHVMRFAEDERARLQALVEGSDWALSGTRSPVDVESDSVIVPADVASSAQ